MPTRKIIPDVIKDQTLVCLPPDASVGEAVQRMAQHRIAAVLVTEGTVLKGIFTERDLTVRVVAAGRDAAATPLSAVMTADPDTLGPDAPASEALDLMERHRYRHLPVVQDGNVVGIVSVRDLYSEVRHHLEEEIKEREAFIFGSQFSVQSP
ncbi:CBS domain-containing protein [Azospirillum sp. ST 5-10]|uniref:CBS domain-containing protein n=1 Tax=unclassified Azospirillum TaxID=2630922 RepID=UPI003F4A2825